MHTMESRESGKVIRMAWHGMPTLAALSSLAQNETNANLSFLRQYLNAWRPAASTTRVFFPDNKELAVARSGATMDPSADRSAMEAQFEDTPFRG